MERERKGKGEVERSRRKVEGDLKLAQELIVDKERYKIDTFFNFLSLKKCIVVLSDG